MNWIIIVIAAILITFYILKNKRKSIDSLKVIKNNMVIGGDMYADYMENLSEKILKKARKKKWKI